jgi:hypothetical protein
MCSSYLQPIVNELVLRAHPHKINVVFEPGTRKFTYGNPMLSNIAVRSREELTGGFVRKGGKPATTQALLRDAPPETRAQVQEQEQDLDDISNILSDISSIAETMGSEIDRQSEQLDRVTNRVDLANEKLYQTNKRIDRLL